MSTPTRIQLSRRRGWRMPPNTVSVAQPGRWGNPWPIGHEGPLGRTAPDAEGAVGLFEQMLRDPEMRAVAGYPEDLSPLRGRNLACWCHLPKPGEPDICHAAVLLRVANEGVPTP